MLDFLTLASGSKGNLYQLSAGKTSLLLDPGVPIAQIKKALNFKLSNISGCLLSHSHQDHSCAAKDIMEAGIDLFCSRETSDALALSGHRLHVIQAMQQFKIGSWAVRPFLIPHDVENFGFLLQNGRDKLAYLIDSAYCPYKFRGLTYIAIGINYQKEILRENVRSCRLDPALARRIMQNHMSLATALNFFRAQDISRVKEVHILHVSSQNADKEQVKEIVQKATGKLVLTA